MDNESAKQLCLALMRADSEREVVEILREKGYWDSSAAWRYFDDNENSFSTMNNQQSRPEAALVEKLINSIDAKLTRECLEAGIDPTSSDAPSTIREAVARFFEDNLDKSNAGLVSEWCAQKRLEVARSITLAATGFKPQEGDMCLTISDDGEGQTPDMVPGTFLSVTRSNKLRIPFVQGKFNMGGTGALKFCGKRKLQLIVTRRAPELLARDHSPDDELWSFTIVRREEPQDGRRNSAYTYLAPSNAELRRRAGGVLRFRSESMPIFPSDAAKAYSRDASFGTLVKLYEYSMPGARSNVIRQKASLLGRLDLMLPRPALPIRIFECREYGGEERSFSTNLTGIEVRLGDNKNESLEEGFGSSVDIRIDGQRLNGMIYAFRKGQAETYRKSEGILFTVNGQTHATISSDFFRRRAVGLSYLSDSLLMVVDCSALDTTYREDLFMNSRDRLSSGELRRKIEDLLEDELKHHQLLRDLREQRRRELIEEQLDEAKPMAEVLEHMIRQSPTLAQLFGIGQRISNPFKSKGVTDKPAPFVGKRYPTYFRPLKKEYGVTVQKACHLGSACRVFFETDAQNDYFSRQIDQGWSELRVSRNGGTQLATDSYRMNPANGVATLSIQLGDNVQVGDTLDFTVVVGDSSQVEPFTNHVKVSVAREQSSNSGGQGRRKPPGNKQGDDRHTPLKLDLPNIVEVREEDWDKQEPKFDENTAVVAKYVGQEDESDQHDTYDFFINMDNKYLRFELKNTRDEPDVISARFKYGLILLILGIIYESSKTTRGPQSDDSADEDETGSLESLIVSVSKALAPMIIPTIQALGSLDVESVGADYSGEES